MRVTNKMLSNSFLSDMRTNLENLQKIQQQMTSGKEFRKPSDDPAKVARAMQLQTDINSNKQYNENITNTTNWLDTTDTALGQVGDVLQKVRELLVQSGNAAYGTEERNSIKDEINQRIDQFAQIMNTSFDGKYLFGGTRGTTTPMATSVDANNNKVINYNATSATDINNIGKKLNVEISPGVTMEYNVTATDILQFKDENNNSKNLKDIFSSIVNDLGPSGSVSNLTGGDLQDLTSAINNLLSTRAEVGAKQNRMESAKTKNEDESFNMTTILSKTEDIDITQKTMEYATLQNVYMASLQTSARVIQPTLLDYLR